MPEAPPLSRLIATGASRLIGGTVGGVVIPSKARTAGLRAASGAGEDYGRTATPSWLEVDWAPHVHDIEVRGRKMRFVDYGPRKGKPVVLIHGISSNWQNWLEQLPRLAAEGYRAYAVDLPGFGFSEMPIEEISISGFADSMEAFCEALGLGAVPVVGHSMGGFTGAELAIRHPDRISKLVLVGAAGITHADLVAGRFAGTGRVYSAVTAQRLAQINALLRRPAARHAILGIIFRHPTLIRGEFIYEIVRGAGTPGFAQALKAIVGYDFRDRLPEVACPTLLVWGSDDMLAPVGDADEFERLIPDTRKIVMKDTGHMINSERPDAFNDALIEFLADEPKRSRRVGRKTAAKKPAAKNGAKAGKNGGAKKPASRKKPAPKRSSAAS